ncbi:cholecystokinin receptor-like [Mytilus trossulus]|uniref:cholecystokinin receptor-like n=1 Tax=Mytilus trossulus TaxID=6551 RepID=UPI003006E4D5
MKITDTTNNITVSKWNDEIVTSLIPNLIVTSVYLVLGICGNVLVLFVYTFKMKKRSDERYFIPVLAVFDLVATFYIGSYDVFQCLHQVNFSNDILCKAAQYFVGVNTFMPITILIIIAFQRYVKICMPLKQAMPPSMKKTLLSFAILLSILIALPLPFVYGVIPFQSTDKTITGMRCGRIKKGRVLIRIVYAAVLGFFAIVIVTTLIVLYSRIGYVVFRIFKTNKQTSTSSQSEDTEQEKQDDSCNQEGDTIETTSDEQIPEVKQNSEEECYVKSPASPVSGSRKRRINNRRISYKLTFMFFVITVVFILSYIPKIILMIIEGIYKDFWETIPTSTRSGAMFVNHIFILNNIANPYIYAFMDKKFRDETKTFLKRVFSKIQCM